MSAKIHLGLNDYMSNIDMLRYLVRYQTAPRVSSETVAEHSFFVAAYVIKLHDYYNFNLENALTMALLHDYAEAFTSDVPHPIKKRYPELDAVLTNIEKDILVEDLSFDIADMLEHFNNVNSAEGAIVALADIMSVIAYAKHEMNLGNSNYMRGVLNKAMQRIDATVDYCSKYLREGVGSGHIIKNLQDYAVITND